MTKKAGHPVIARPNPLPITTKAIRVHQTGGADALVFEDVVLAPPGPGEIQIRHHAIGVNYIDIYFRSGLYPAPTPFIPGNEGVGEVIALGKGVQNFVIGDRVAYAGPLGSYAEIRNIAESVVVKLPKSISYEQGAAMMLKGLTAQFLLRKTYRVKAGDVILVHAAAGGVGSLLCQWSKALGAIVIGAVGSPEKAKIAKKNGAKHVIPYNEEDFVERVKKLTKGALCDVVYDGVGKATFPGSLDCLKPFGVFVSFGSASGQIEAFDIGLLAQKGSLYATRPTLFSHTTNRESLVKMARELMKAVADGTIKITISAKHKLEDAAEAHRQLESRATTGSSILLP